MRQGDRLTPSLVCLSGLAGDALVDLRIGGGGFYFWRIFIFHFSCLTSMFFLWNGVDICDPSTTFTAYERIAVLCIFQALNLFLRVGIV